MKTNLLLASIFSLAMLNMNAQFFCDFEDCGNNGDPYSDCLWTDWGCGGGIGCSILCTTDQVHNGNYAGLIPNDGTTDAILDLGNKIFGEWHFTFWMYVPSNQEAYWNIQGVVPVGAGEWVIGNVFFNQDNANPGVGLCDNTALGPVNFTFPHDEWFEIEMNWDISLGISLATWEWFVDGVEVLPAGTPFTDGSGTVPTSLGGFDFFSISSNNLYYLDEFCFSEGIDSECDLGVDEPDFKNSITLIPNPINNILIIENTSTTEITSIRIYDVLGRLVMSENGNVDQINVSHLNSGVLFVELETDQGVITKKVIKN